MRVCRVKATGRIIEGQSFAREGTLIQNALSCGHKPEDIEELEMPAIDYFNAIEIQDAPTAKQLAAKAQEQTKEDLLKHIDYLTRLVLELKAREEARGGVKLEAVPVELSTKLASLEVSNG